MDNDAIPSPTPEDERSEDEVFADSGRALKLAIEARPNATSELLDIVKRRVGSAVGENTWRNIEVSLADYLNDTEAANILGWVLSEPGDAFRVSELERVAGPEAAELAGVLRAMYGVELRRAKGMGDFPDDWHSLTHSVYQTVTTGKCFIELSIVNEAGARFTIDSPADSMLSFAEFVLEAIEIAGRDAFNAEHVETFISQVGALASRWQSREDGSTPTDS